MSTGTLYVATGEPFLKEAETSAMSMHDHNNISASVITTRDLKIRWEDRNHPFDSIIEAEHVYDDFRDWIFNIHLSPYDRTIYFDTDTRIIGDISDIFSLMNRFDILVSNDPTHRHDGVPIPNVPESIPQINTGVLAFNHTEGVMRYFNEAKELFQMQIQGKRNKTLEKTGHPGLFHDQYPLTEVLYNSDIRFAILPREYNFRGHVVRVNSEVKVIHLRRQHLQKITKYINKNIESRVYFTDRRKIQYQESRETVYIGIPLVDHIVTDPSFKKFLQKVGAYNLLKRFYYYITT